MPTDGSDTYALDTSLAVAALDESHEAHEVCRRTAMKHRPALAGHAAFETFSVLTRLPGASRASPETAIRIIKLAFPERCWLSSRQCNALLDKLPTMEIAGGMVYDAMVAEAARVHGRILLTRDARAKNTYERIGVLFRFID